MRHTYAVLFLVLSLGTLCAADMSLANAERILKDEKENPQALFSVSFYFQQAGRPFSALRAIERAIEIKPDVPGFHARYGQLLSQRHRLIEAATEYGKAAEMDKNTKAFRAAQARAHAQANQLKEAIAAWRILLDGTTDR
jgi:tetratricopeptide (TPR) repeat protein